MSTGVWENASSLFMCSDSTTREGNFIALVSVLTPGALTEEVSDDVRHAIHVLYLSCREVEGV